MGLYRLHTNATEALWRQTLRYALVIYMVAVFAVMVAVLPQLRGLEPGEALGAAIGPFDLLHIEKAAAAHGGGSTLTFALQGGLFWLGVTLAAILFMILGIVRLRKSRQRDAPRRKP